MASRLHEEHPIVTWHDTRELTDDPAPEAAPPPPTPVVIRAYPDGPLLIRGTFALEDLEQGPIALSRRVVALCRCGKSKATPLCDGSHRARRSTQGACEPGLAAS